MIDRQHGNIIICCDDCSATIEGREDDGFPELWARARKIGWKTRKIAGEWLDACEDCETPR